MKKVLFLDDEDSILSMYKRVFRNSNIICYFAKNITTAEEIIKNEKIDLVVSDYRLEQETGLDFIKKLRTNHLNIPMIILSGFADEELVLTAVKNAIIQEYILKPINADELRKLLDKYLKLEQL